MIHVEITASNVTVYLYGMCDVCVCATVQCLSSFPSVNLRKRAMFRLALSCSRVSERVRTCSNRSISLLFSCLISSSATLAAMRCSSSVSVCRSELLVTRGMDRESHLHVRRLLGDIASFMMSLLCRLPCVVCLSDPSTVSALRLARRSARNLQR